MAEPIIVWQWIVWMILERHTDYLTQSQKEEYEALQK